MGTMQFGRLVGEADSLHILSRTFELGINFIDMAGVYSKWVENLGALNVKLTEEEKQALDKLTNWKER
jgi:aryl-alcohol dehydrogenase-like predicted oxidoreductase